MKEKIITIILPIRVTKQRLLLINQVSNLFMDTLLPESIDFILVDDGSEKEYSKKIKKECKSLSIKYLYLETSSQSFSLARARNAGAKIAVTPFIMFQDVDMMPYNGFYNDLINEVKAQELEKRIHSFIMISTIYLSEKGTKKYLSSLKQYFIDKMIIGDAELIDKFSSATSLILLNRQHFKNIGAYDEIFSKWGHEDIDLNCRLILADNFLSLPKHFSRDERNFNNIFEYRGWKSIYRLYGDRTFLKGIVLFHSWHETNQKNEYYSNKTRNKKRFHFNLKKYIREYMPHDSFHISEKSILLDRYQHSISFKNRMKPRLYYETKRLYTYLVDIFKKN